MIVLCFQAEDGIRYLVRSRGLGDVYKRQVMAHSDDQGLILPPKIAPFQVVIVPIYKGDEQKALIDGKVKEISNELKAMGIRVKYDDNDNARPGLKFAEYEMKGVPVRLAIGARDL